MKKIILVFSLIVIYTIGLISFFEFKNKNAKEYNVGNKLSVMVENDKGYYEPSKDNKWPEGYVLNEDLSKCEKSSTLKWNNDTRTITLSTDKTDKCYVYFEKDDLGYRCKNKEIASCFIENYEIDKAIIYHNLEDASKKKFENYELVADDDSYRYAGGNEIVNNYVCLDETTVEEECTDEGLYRIIGLFKNEEEYEIKIIKNTSIGDKIWYVKEDSNKGGDTTADGHYPNEWEYSEIKNDINNLNGDYYISLGENIQKLILNHQWEIRGANTNAMIPQQIYKYEMGIEEDTAAKCIANPETTEANIGLMYASEYGYAASANWWNINLVDYNLAKDDNWLYASTSNREWTLSRRSDGAAGTYNIVSNGAVHDSHVSLTFMVRPVFYLISTVKLSSGDGTISNPYRIAQ